MGNEDNIQVGLASTNIFTVEKEHSAAHIGSGSIGVLATPAMIAFMEITARKMLDELLPDSHTTVGTHVDVRHRAAAAIGAKVEAHVEVKSREGNRLGLSVDLFHGERLIGSGSHERVIIEKARFLEGLKPA